MTNLFVMRHSGYVRNFESTPQRCARAAQSRERAVTALRVDRG
jgi:hypothetical protein